MTKSLKRWDELIGALQTIVLVPTVDVVALPMELRQTIATTLESAATRFREAEDTGRHLDEVLALIHKTINEHEGVPWPLEGDE